MTRLVERIFGRLRRRLGILLAALVLLSFVPWLLSSNASRHLEGVGHQLDHAGSLRYRLLELAFVAAERRPGGADEIARISDLQIDILDQLIEGDPIHGIPGCLNSGACARLHAHRQLWIEEIVPAALAGSDGLHDLVMEELSALDQTVHEMASEAESTVVAIERLGTASSAIGVLLVVVVGFVIWDVFSRIRGIEAAARADSPEERLHPLAEGTDEVAALARSIAASLSAQRLLEEAERERVEGLLSAVPDAVLVVDGEGLIDYANAQVEALFGWPLDELLGRPIETLVPDAARGRHASLRAGYAKDPRVRAMGKELQIRGQRKNGQTFYADIKLAPVTIRGEVMFVTSVRDVTEARETTRRLAELGENLETANESLSAQNTELEQFTFAASHDLQEPLRKIIAFGDRLERKYSDQLDEQARDYLVRMTGAAGRMQNLIADLLRWSRLTTKAQPFAPVDLDDVMADVVDDLEIAIERAGASVNVEPLSTIDADETQVRQLFQNLVENAIKYRNGERTPEVEIRGEATEDGRYQVTVSDNGIGFDPKYAERIFDVFERLHGRGEYEGTGIGLALCRKIVRRHGGTITVTSEPGVGTSFATVFPTRTPQREDTRT